MSNSRVMFRCVRWTGLMNEVKWLTPRFTKVTNRNWVRQCRSQTNESSSTLPHLRLWHIYVDCYSAVLQLKWLREAFVWHLTAFLHCELSFQAHQWLRAAFESNHWNIGCAFGIWRLRFDYRLSYFYVPPPFCSINHIVKLKRARSTKRILNWIQPSCYVYTIFCALSLNVHTLYFNCMTVNRVYKLYYLLTFI